MTDRPTEIAPSAAPRRVPPRRLPGLDSPMSATQRGFPYRGYPTGWYQIAWSPEIEAGEATPFRYFGRDLVCYRGESGQVHVLDAHCPHLGAHLGYGGRVAGDEIICPFHGWQWRASGELSSVPDGGRRPRRIQIGCWPVHETSSLILLWYDELGRPPSWWFPGMPENDDAHFYRAYPHGCFLEPVNFPPQFSVENAVDATHIKYVHRWQEVPTVDDPVIDGPRFLNRIRGVVRTPKGPATVEVTNDVWGLGLFSTRLVGLADTAAVAAVTPIDETTSHFRVSLWISRPHGATGTPDDEPCGIAQAIIEAQYREVLGPGGDRPIFEHQRYITRPPLTKQEARGFAALRRWARQFYPEATHDPDPASQEESAVPPESFGSRP